MNKNFDQTISSIKNHQILSPLVKKRKEKQPSNFKLKLKIIYPQL